MVSEPNVCDFAFQMMEESCYSEKSKVEVFRDLEKSNMEAICDTERRQMEKNCDFERPIAKNRKLPPRFFATQTV